VLAVLDYGQHEPLAFADAGMLVARCLGELRFPEKVAVSTSARRHRRLDNPGAYSGPWGGGPYFTAHLDPIMDCLAADSPYREVWVMGPSQVGKSEIGNNWQLHTVIYDPTDMLFVMPDRISIDSYVKTQFDKMIELSVDDDGRPGALSQRLLSGASADTINLKRFRGADFHFLWPSGPTFRARPIPRGRLDDLDDIPTDIADQGDAVSLMRGRMGSFAAYGRTMIYVNSTPKLGARAGIELGVAGGTDQRLWVDCLQCGEPFALTSDRLDFDRTGTPEDAAASATVVCEKNGCVHEPRDKRRLLQGWRWIGRGQHALPLADGGVYGELVASQRASFRLDGIYGFRPWSEMALLARRAELAFEFQQDEGPLKAFDQTIVGRNYRARSQGAAPVTEDELISRAKASPYVMGEVPPGVRVLVATIDQQGNRFEVAVWGFGEHFRSWLVDRFAILTINRDGRQEPLRPFTRPEDWAVIHSYVMQQTYPLAGAPHLQMKLFNTAVDTGGLDNATDNAFAWWHAMVSGDTASGRPPIPATAITLLKGGNNSRGKLLPAPTIDAKRQIRGAQQAELYVPNVHRLKDIAEVRLNRRDDGPGYMQFPRDLPGVKPGDANDYFAELRAEVKQDDVWVRDPHKANETWDLYVYALAVLLRFGGMDGTLAWVPEWARPPRGGPKALAVAAPDSAGGFGVDAAMGPDPAPVMPIKKHTAPGSPQRRRKRSIRAHRAQ
jgi:phage terminase large subunit GpA-like protein